MNRLLRILLIILGILVILLLVAGIAGFVTARQPFPETTGTVTVPGLSGEVQVVRDEWGVPHIYADNVEDLFFAQGYVHAQDRFWQMDFWRHIGQGRIAEIAGESAVENDKFIRTFGWNRLAQETLEYYEENAPEELALLEAYSAGVNAYITSHPDELGLQFTILGLVQKPWAIEPWEPLDTFGWAVVMSDNLASDYGDELDRARLNQDIGEGTTETLLRGYPFDERPVIATTEEIEATRPDEEAPEEEEGEGDAESAIDWNQISTTLIGAPPVAGFGQGPFIGSNNWVIGGEHTETGEPLLANDPHLSVQMPSIWYEIGLHAPGYNVRGFSFAGSPAVIIGHNDRIAWGVTTSGPDVQDLYIEKINPANPLQYEYEGEWQDMEVIEEVIKVNGGEDVVLEVKKTRHGPVVTEVVTEEDDPGAIKDVLSVKWSAAEPSRSLMAVFALNQAQNVDEFYQAARMWDIPSQNIIYADVDGNIAYMMPGRIPVRARGDGTVPVPGWTDEYEWEGWIPEEQLPFVVNPEKGYIITANNAVVDEDYPHLLNGFISNDGDRAQRIENMITEIIDGGKINAADIARIQFDSKSLPAETYVPLLQGLSSDDEQVQAALERLRGWDLQERRDSVPAALWELTYLNLLRNALVDDVGEENLGRVESNVLMHDLAAQPESIWWDDQTTAEEETREDILLRSVADAVTWLEENVGGDMNDWTWGRIHTITFEDGVLGQSGIGPIEAIFNRGPFPADGGRAIVNANSWRTSEPAIVTSHPSMRMIVDLSDFDASQSIHPTGQSGHPYHPHYDDFVEPWLNGEYHPMLYSADAVNEYAADVLVLQPGE